MAIKRMQMYRKNLDTSETNLYPLTEAQYVSMENGQTVQEILSDRDSDKYTPVITNSSSTFKVGQGDNVDLSSSMKEGAYDSCVLKGKTMVNCIQEPSSKDVVLPYEFADGRYVTINDTKESGALGVELKGQTLVNLVPKKIIDYTASSDWDGYHQLVQNSKQSFDEWRALQDLKPNTKYYISCYVETFEVVNNEGYCLNNPSVESIFGDSMIVNGVGRYQWVSTTKSELTDEIFMALRCQNAFARGAIKIRDIMIIEYQQGMENWNIPYFEDMASCKMPILHTVGKNLITQSFINTLCNLDNWEGTGAYRNNRKAGELLALFPSNSYVTQVPALTIPANFYPIIYLSYQDESSVSNGHILASGIYNNNTDSEMVCPERQWRFSVNSKNVVVRGYVNEWNQENMNKLKTVMTQSIQMEIGTTTTAYEQGKSSILSLPEEVVLRSLPNGVCDTFNTRTGVYTQRIGEVVLNGSESWNPNNTEGTTTQRFFCNMLTNSAVENSRGTQQYLCDRLRTIVWNQTCELGLTVNGSGVFVYNNAIEYSASSVKQWLSQNPVRLQYELATPIITKINLPSTLKSWNTTTHIYSEIPENTLYPILSHSNPTYPVILKPSTKYSIVANSYSNNHTNSTINFNLGGATASTTVGNRVTTITTPSTLSNELLTMSGRGNKLNNVMVIEGDVAGDESYFEGICDCKSPILSNVGKNLVNVDNYVNYPSENIPIVKDGENSYIIENKKVGSWQNRCVDKIKLKANTTYTLSYDSEVLSASVPMVYATVLNLRNDLDTSINVSGDVSPNKPRTFTPTQDMLVRLCMYATDTSGGTNRIKFSNIQLEESSSRTTYEPYKSSAITFDQKDDKTIVLRSLPNGACDTLNVETGEYVQRIGEKVFDGSNNGWQVLTYPPHDNDTHYQFKYWFGENLIGGDLWQNAQSIIANTLPSASGTLHWSSQGKYGIGGDRSNIMITWEKNSCPFNDVTTLNAWLQSNPLTIQYELATPIVSTIDVQGFPYAYTSGHVQLSSGHSEQSLTPKVEYSLSANKTGQINSNTKRVSAHQKQLDDFEAMMLTSMVQSAYDKAILQFDYEMQMMSLGGE